MDVLIIGQSRIRLGGDCLECIASSTKAVANFQVAIDCRKLNLRLRLAEQQNHAPVEGPPALTTRSRIRLRCTKKLKVSRLGQRGRLATLTESVVRGGCGHVARGL